MAAEHLPLFHVGNRRRERAIDRSETDQRDNQPFARQLRHHLCEPATFTAAEQIAGRYRHVLEEKFAGVLSAHADLVELPATAQSARLPSVDNDQRNGFRTLFVVVPHGDAEQVRKLAVADEGFGSVDDVSVAASHRRGSQTAQVRSGAGL